MNIYKFGGASVKDAAAIQNVVDIVRQKRRPLVIVVSAIGKTTNALERLWTAYVRADEQAVQEALERVCRFHRQLISELGHSSAQFNEAFEATVLELCEHLSTPASASAAYDYDQLVSYGEIWSTIIVEQALRAGGIRSQWMDARQLIRTSDHHQEARVDWATTQQLICQEISFEREGAPACVVTQGFIGHTSQGATTTLGREGSDFSAAILAWALDAAEVWIWKDVPGLLNADPKFFENTVKIDRISYREAIELSYFGASIIHPKTLKPLQNKHIPLRIKCFTRPHTEGTIIHLDESHDSNQPSYIYKRNQLLITISPTDFSFIMEDHISVIFNVFAKHGVKVHLMQNSALNFSVCADVKPAMRAALFEELNADFLVRYNEDVDLYTVRHYETEELPAQFQGKTVLLQQRSRSTLRYVLGGG